ncbi:hypothetical protein HZU83_09835 [Sphaerotilus montanus]|uniref:Glycosyltransferase family 1 protein n=1 Tax=Sphaerotilus montanus TaxID=522889 RepID=A0A7Y9R0T6_9BURK|nr:hypothetical protein [Sphaerotilus montanus]NYG33383.1 hypothetical protein [Sphaerotilus montanus]NZD56983.1 hypothetical protein [Sphaerotilus montanus]
MIQMYPKAIVLTNQHPFGGTEMMAQSIRSALDANGYDTRIININDRNDLESLPVLVSDPHLALVMTTGTLPLLVRIDGKPIWRAIAAQVQFITYVIDAWPYDYVRVEPFRRFIEDWNIKNNLHTVSLEANDAKLIGPRAHYMPSGAYPAPHRQGPKIYPDRLFMWASANKELAVTMVHDEFRDTFHANNAWHLSEQKIERASEALRYTTTVHGLSAIAAALETPADILVKPDTMTALCALDSCLKRYRRVKVAKALRGLPVDIYGENWEQHVGGTASFRLLKPNPDHNHAFGYICQQYAGLFNFDPNFGHGTNERAVSALAMGIPIANNFNIRTDHLSGCYPYHFSDESIRIAAERLLNHEGEVPIVADHTWEYLIGLLLRGIARQTKN